MAYSKCLLVLTLVAVLGVQNAIAAPLTEKFNYIFLKKDVLLKIECAGTVINLTKDTVCAVANAAKPDKTCGVGYKPTGFIFAGGAIADNAFSLDITMDALPTEPIVMKAGCEGVLIFVIAMPSVKPDVCVGNAAKDTKECPLYTPVAGETYGAGCYGGFTTDVATNQVSSGLWTPDRSISASPISSLMDKAELKVLLDHKDADSKFVFVTVKIPTVADVDAWYLTCEGNDGYAARVNVLGAGNGSNQLATSTSIVFSAAVTSMVVLFFK